MNDPSGTLGSQLYNLVKNMLTDATGGGNTASADMHNLTSATDGGTTASTDIYNLTTPPTLSGYIPE